MDNYVSTQIAINGDNFEETSNDFVVRFPISQRFNEQQISVSQINIYHSFPNISASQGNNNISIFFPDADGYTEFQFVLEDGLYTMATFYNWLKMKLLASYLYTQTTVNLTTTVNYPIFFGENNTYEKIAYFYAITQSSTLPSLSPVSLPTTAKSPYIDFKTTSLSNVFGFSQTVLGTGASTNNYVHSDIVAKQNQTENIIFTTNLINNSQISYPSNMIANIPVSGVYGGLLSKTYAKRIWTDISSQQFDEIQISIYTQNLLKLKVIDKNLSILLSFRDKPKIKNIEE